MAPPPKPSARPRPLLAALAFLGAGLVAVLAWKAWDATRQAELAVARPAPPRPVQPALPPPAPDVPYNALVTSPMPVEAPAIDLPTVDGKRFSLAASRGQVVFVNFWATWCPPCAKEMPSMVKLGQALARRHPGKFRMVAVSVDETPQIVKDFFARPPYGGLPRDVTVAMEPQVGAVTRAYYCRGRGACRPDDVKFPETYIVDRAGRIAAFVVGDIDWSEPEAQKFLERLITG